MPAKKVIKAVVGRVRKRVHPIGSKYTRYFSSEARKSQVLQNYQKAKAAYRTRQKEYRKLTSEGLWTEPEMTFPKMWKEVYKTTRITGKFGKAAKKAGKEREAIRVSKREFNKLINEF